MTDATLNNLVRLWARAGVGFNATPAACSPDLERLLLDTARAAPRMSRLFIMAATWVSRYDELVAKHRLARLATDELEPEHRPTLGLLLDIAQQGTRLQRFQSLMDHLAPDADDEPRLLFDIDRTFRSAARRVERGASPESRRWNRLAQPLELKPDALRAAKWIMEQNPSYRLRADFRGDLRASVLASLAHDPGADESELALARAAGGSRAQVRQALDNLALTQRVQRERLGRRTQVKLGSRLAEMIHDA